MEIGKAVFLKFALKHMGSTLGRGQMIRLLYNKGEQCVWDSNMDTTNAGFDLIMLVAWLSLASIN